MGLVKCKECGQECVRVSSRHIFCSQSCKLIHRAGVAKARSELELDDPPPPSEAEIAQRAKAIRSRWTPEEAEVRRGGVVE